MVVVAAAAVVVMRGVDWWWCMGTTGDDTNAPLQDIILHPLHTRTW